MILLREPSDARIRRFLDAQRSLPFSYPEGGAARVSDQPVSRPVGRGARDLRAGGRGDPKLEDVRDGVDQAPLARSSHRGGHRGWCTRAPLWSLVSERVQDHLHDRRQSSITETLRLRRRHATRARRAGRRALHGRVARDRRLGVLRTIRFLPPIPPTSHGGTAARTSRPETLRARLTAEHDGHSRSASKKLKSEGASLSVPTRREATCQDAIAATS
jgi:hypothetical protein